MRREHTPESVREWRSSWKLTRTQAGDLTGTAAESWKRWETGRRKVPRYLPGLMRDGERRIINGEWSRDGGRGPATRMTARPSVAP